MSNKNIIIGLDLSFNSTGITIFNEAENTLNFNRVVYEKIPREIQNVNQYVYSMPSNVNSSELSLTNDNNTLDQIDTTLRAMTASKVIINIIKSNLESKEFDNLIVVFENYIMPSFGGKNSLKNVSGLILLQGYIREFIIKLLVTTGSNKNIKIFTPSPTSNKKFFAGDGSADKNKMLDVFINKYNGKELIPDLNKNLSVNKINDVVDSFSLMCHGLNEFRNNHKQ